MNSYRMRSFRYSDNGYGSAERRWLLSSLLLIHLLALSVIAQTPWDWNVGEVEEGTVHETLIEIPNRSDRPLEILQARPSCGCLQVNVLQARASSGESLRIRVRLDTTGLASPFRKFIYLQTNRTEPPLLRLTVSGTLTHGTKRGLLPVEFYYDPDAPARSEVERLLQELQARFPSRIDMRTFDMTEVTHYRRLIAREETLGVTQVAPLELFVGDLYLAGADAIRHRLVPLIENLLEPSADESTNAPHAAQAIPLHFYYTPGCRECREAKAWLLETRDRLAAQSPPIYISIHGHDLSQAEEYAQLVALERQQDVRSNEPMSVWVGGHYLVGLSAIRNGLDAAIRDAAHRPATASLPPGNVEAIRGRFRSFSLLAVMGAGLIDGINPCAFATLVFFVSLLGVTGYRRRDVMLVGCFYGLAVFATYLLIGLGLFHAIRALRGFETLSHGFYTFTIGFALVLALLSLLDAVNYARTGHSRDIVLQLPRRIKRQIHATIRDNLRRSHLVFGALMIGILVSGLESLCTGQVYLPTIALVVREGALRWHAIGYLILYNIWFIVPLAVVFLVTILGVSSERLARFAQRNVVWTKLLTAGLFAGLATLMLV